MTSGISLTRATEIAGGSNDSTAEMNVDVSGIAPVDEPTADRAVVPGQYGRRSGDQLSRRRLAVRNVVTIGAVSMAALGLLLTQSLVRGHLGGMDEYDDGVYFAAALALVHGLLPYQSFAFLQPPLVTVWLAPFAALASSIGTASAFEASRIFIDVVSSANVAMLGLLLRRRPTLQVLVATVSMAAFPGFVQAAQTVLIEPLLVFLCLAGLLCLYEGGSAAEPGYEGGERISRSWRRVLFAGVLFGLAGATKLWALFPFVAVLVVLWRCGLRARLAWIAGGAAGFLLSTLPFIIATPSGFYHQVILIQAIRNSSGYADPARLAALTGLPGLYTAVTSAGNSPTWLLDGVCAAIAALCLVAFLRRPHFALDSVESIAVIAAVLIGAGLYFAPTFYYHYPAFIAPFVAIVYGTIAIRLRPRISWRIVRAGTAYAAAVVRLVAATLVTGAALAVIIAMVNLRVQAIASQAAARTVTPIVGNALPARGCILSTDPSIPILDDRFTASTNGCPSVIDWLGQERVLDHGLSAVPANMKAPALQALWLRSVKESVAVIIGSNPEWGTAVTSYFHRNFHQARGEHEGFVVSVRDARTAT